MLNPDSKELMIMPKKSKEFSEKTKTMLLLNNPLEFKVIP